MKCSSLKRRKRRRAHLHGHFLIVIRSRAPPFRMVVGFDGRLGEMVTVPFLLSRPPIPERIATRHARRHTRRSAGPLLLDEEKVTVYLPPARSREPSHCVREIFNVSPKRIGQVVRARGEVIVCACIALRTPWRIVRSAAAPPRDWDTAGRDV